MGTIYLTWVESFHTVFVNTYMLEIARKFNRSIEEPTNDDIMCWKLLFEGKHKKKNPEVNKGARQCGVTPPRSGNPSVCTVSPNLTSPNGRRGILYQKWLKKSIG